MNRNVITICIPAREKLALKNYYATAKLETCSFQSASEALECVRNGATRLIVINLSSTPIEESLRSISELRSVTYVPILAIISRSQPVEDVINLGADVCIPNDTDCEYIFGHSYALIRRFSLYCHCNHRDPESSILYRGELVIDPLRRYVYLGEDQIRLRPREYRLLLYFATNPGIVLTKEQISENIWPMEEGIQRDVSELISDLRRALHENSNRPQYIETVHGVGYRFLPTK